MDHAAIKHLRRETDVEFQSKYVGHTLLQIFDLFLYDPLINICFQLLVTQFTTYFKTHEGLVLVVLLVLFQILRNITKYFIEKLAPVN